jgi:hypothetical protein
VSLTDCDCAQRHAVPAAEIPASDLETIHADLVPEATGEPDLTNAAVEGDDVPPATHGEFESLGADAFAHGPAPVKPKKSKG